MVSLTENSPRKGSALGEASGSERDPVSWSCAIVLSSPKSVTSLISATTYMDTQAKEQNTSVTRLEHSIKHILWKPAPCVGWTAEHASWEISPSMWSFETSTGCISGSDTSSISTSKSWADIASGKAQWQCSTLLHVHLYHYLYPQAAESCVVLLVFVLQIQTQTKGTHSTKPYKGRERPFAISILIQNLLLEFKFSSLRNQEQPLMQM